MAPFLGLLQLSLLATVAIVFVASAVSGGLYLGLRGRLGRLAPASRAKLLVTWAATPAALGLALTVLCFLPSITLLLLGSNADHCIAHDDHHGHLCLLHPPHDAGSALVWALLGAALLVAIAQLLRGAHAFLSAHRALGALSRTDGGTQRVVWVASAKPFALTIGLFRPRVLVSTALRKQLRPELMAAVVEHEEAHRRRGDVLRKTVAALLSTLHWPAVRRRLLADLNLACEQAADADAAERLSDPLIVAEAILSVERMSASYQQAWLPAGASFGGPTVGARVEALLEREAVHSLRLGRWIAGTAILGVLMSEPLHHAVETLLTPFAR
jgi:Zn-dependent protease with chaperone function